MWQLEDKTSLDELFTLTAGRPGRASVDKEAPDVGRRSTSGTSERAHLRRREHGEAGRQADRAKLGVGIEALRPVLRDRCRCHPSHRTAHAVRSASR